MRSASRFSAAKCAVGETAGRPRAAGSRSSASSDRVEAGGRGAVQAARRCVERRERRDKIGAREAGAGAEAVAHRREHQLRAWPRSSSPPDRRRPRPATSRSQGATRPRPRAAARARCAAPAAASRSSRRLERGDGRPVARGQVLRVLERPEAGRRRGSRPGEIRRGGGRRARRASSAGVLDRAAERRRRCRSSGGAARPRRADSSPCVVFSPTRSFQAAGTRTEPAVSEPIAAAARPKATDAAAPDDEPPGASSGSLMFGGVAVTGLTPEAGERQLGQVGLAEADQPGPRRGGEHRGVALRHPARRAAPIPPRWRPRRCRRGPSS